jgi:hypothetical protein
VGGGVLFVSGNFFGSFLQFHGFSFQKRGYLMKRHVKIDLTVGGMDYKCTYGRKE